MGLKDTELLDFIGVIDQVGQLEDIWGGKRDVTLKDETGHIKFSIWKETARDFPGKELRATNLVCWMPFFLANTYRIKKPNLPKKT